MADQTTYDLSLDTDTISDLNIELGELISSISDPSNGLIIAINTLNSTIGRFNDSTSPLNASGGGTNNSSSDQLTTLIQNSSNVSDIIKTFTGKDGLLSGGVLEEIMAGVLTPEILLTVVGLAAIAWSSGLFGSNNANNQYLSDQDNGNGQTPFKDNPAMDAAIKNKMQEDNESISEAFGELWGGLKDMGDSYEETKLKNSDWAWAVNNNHVGVLKGSTDTWLPMVEYLKQQNNAKVQQDNIKQQQAYNNAFPMGVMAPDNDIDDILVKSLLYPQSLISNGQDGSNNNMQSYNNIGLYPTGNNPLLVGKGYAPAFNNYNNNSNQNTFFNYTPIAIPHYSTDSNAMSVNNHYNNLIGQFTINSTNLEMDLKQVKMLVAQAIMDSVKDIHIGSTGI